MPAREKVLLTEMPNRFRQKKMGLTPIIFLPVVAPEPRKKPHAQRLCEYSIFNGALQSGERPRGEALTLPACHIVQYGAMLDTGRCKRP
ncbi:MAG TPA: hypothetical protein VL635_16310 [Trinickia sp.]|nr:hypothetical protein [Trinickia sp.]